MTALETVQAYYAAFNRRDWAGMLALLSPNIRHDANQGNSYTGLEHFQHFLAHMDACYEEQLKDLVLLTDDSGTRVSCEFTVHGIYKKTDGDLPPATGQTYVLPAGSFLDVQDGKITRITTYYNLPQWIRMVRG